MNDALIGYTGFVGSTLLEQHKFGKLYRSTNINEISGQEFRVLVCAGAPGQKWLANKEPDKDRENIELLMDSLKQVKCKQFILISTIDVFNKPSLVYENSIVDEVDIHPYGLNRRLLEKFVEQNFENSLIIRLPGLVGNGLRKNVIYDLKNNNNLEQINTRGVFQFYPMQNLWYDIEIALANDLNLLHLTASPISVEEVIIGGFGFLFNNNTAHNNVVTYDMRTNFSHLFGGGDNYQYSLRETIQAIRSYAQS